MEWNAKDRIFCRVLSDSFCSNDRSVWETVKLYSIYKILIKGKRFKFVFSQICDLEEKC